MHLFSQVKIKSFSLDLNEICCYFYLRSACIFRGKLLWFLTVSITQMRIFISTFREAGVYLPVNGNGEDGPDVGQHPFEVFWIFLEAHFCQDQRFADIFARKEKTTISLFPQEQIQFRDWTESCLPLVDGPRTTSPPTFLSRHFDGVSVAERPLPFARCVHFVLHAAVHNPKLYLRSGKPQWLMQKSTTKSPSALVRPTSFFTVKPIDTDTNGNLPNTKLVFNEPRSEKSSY